MIKQRCPYSWAPNQLWPCVQDFQLAPDICQDGDCLSGFCGPLGTKPWARREAAPRTNDGWGG